MIIKRKTNNKIVAAKKSIKSSRRKPVRATVDDNLDISTIQKQFPVFLGEIKESFEGMTDDVYEYWDTKNADDPIDNYYEPFRVEGTKFISERTLVDFELNLWYGRTEVGTVLITYNAEEDVPFTVTVSDSDTVQAEGNSFDGIYDVCLSELERLAEDYANFVIAEY